MVIAEELAKKQRAISIAQFFEKNKQILGFDSLQKSLIMAVKESVDNSLDACEEAEILPEIEVVLKNLGKDEYYLSVEDNGPGIIRKEIPKIFGQFLYGSKFFSMQQARGQQGIGISAVVLYSQITSGKPITVTSKTKESDVAYQIKMFIDTKENRAAIVSEDVIIVSKEHGLKIEFYMKGKYVKGKQSIIEYLKNSAIVNPYAKIKFTDPDGSVIIFDRVTDKIPVPPKETKPHPMGLEVGDILELAKNTKHKTLTSFLSGEFSKVSNKIAVEICTMTKLDPGMDPSALKLVDAKNILESFKQTKLLPPSSESLSPIALKSANILNKPVPKLEPIITQIMNVVWIDEDIEESKDTVKVTVRVSNFTAEEKKFKLYADLPEGKVLEGSVDSDCKIDSENDSIEWEISIKSLEQKVLKFTLSNVISGTYKESTYYVEGINPVYVVGAEPLPGDWNIEDLKAIIADDNEMEEDENDEL